MNTPLNTRTPALLAFHGKKAVKAKYLARTRAHRKADEIRQSYGYWRPDADGKFRGCAVGCTLHSGNHNAYETELGIPRAIAYLEDKLFEWMPADKAKDWPVKFLDAIRPGADLSTVIPEFLVWLLVDEKDGVLQFARESSVQSIKDVAALCQRKMKGDDPSPDEWRRAHANAAASANADAADDAPWRARRASRAAKAAAEAAALALAWAAWAEALALAAYCFKASEKLLEILRSRAPASPSRGVRKEVAA